LRIARGRLRRTRSASGLLLTLLLLRTFSVALPLLLAVAARPAFGTLSRTVRTLRTIGPGSALLFAARLAGALFELAHLPFHEPPRLLIEPRLQLVMPAVRAPLPSLGIGLLAAGTEDGLRERHLESARIVHFGAVDESRRKTLHALMQLATENSPNACFDDRRAAGILRRETTAEELREMGMDEKMIAFVFEEENDR